VCDSLGTATNNVAEYSGLVAGLRTAAELEPGADVEVRMDSKLVVEQMSGRRGPSTLTPTGWRTRRWMPLSTARLPMASCGGESVQARFPLTGRWPSRLPRRDRRSAGS